MVDYDKFAKTFSNSRKNLAWPEIDYFIEYISQLYWEKRIKILDVGCGNGRLLKYLKQSNLQFDYMWVDSSSWMIDEAKQEFSDDSFEVLDMINIDKLWQKFDIVFFIASFHHLETIEDRIRVLLQTKNLLNTDWQVLLTNWNLMWEGNMLRYQKSYLWNWDFSIKIGDFNRYYRWFLLDELEKLFTQTWFNISKNEIFSWKNNLISIIT